MAEATRPAQVVPIRKKKLQAAAEAVEPVQVAPINRLQARDSKLQKKNLKKIPGKVAEVVNPVQVAPTQKRKKTRPTKIRPEKAAEADAAVQFARL